MQEDPEVRAVLEAAAHLQELVPDAVLVGGTAAAHHAGHRVSLADDHVVADLRGRFDEVLTALEETDVVLGIDAFWADQQGPTGRRVATQVAKQLAEPRPGDLSEIDLRSYRGLDRRWQDWGSVAHVCHRVAIRVLDQLAGGAR